MDDRMDISKRVSRNFSYRRRDFNNIKSSERFIISSDIAPIFCGDIDLGKAFAVEMTSLETFERFTVDIRLNGEVRYDNIDGRSIPASIEGNVVVSEGKDPMKILIILANSYNMVYMATIYRSSTK